MTVDIWRMIGFMGAVFDFKDGTFTVPNFQNMMTFRTQAVSTLEEGESSSSGPLTPAKLGSHVRLQSIIPLKCRILILFINTSFGTESCATDQSYQK